MGCTEASALLRLLLMLNGEGMNRTRKAGTQRPSPSAKLLALCRATAGFSLDSHWTIHLLPEKLPVCALC